MTSYLNPIEESNSLVDSVCRSFAEFWKSAPILAAVAPGRVNVIGEHVDYNGGWVLPAAIERHMVLAVRPRDDGRIRLAAAGRLLNASHASLRDDYQVSCEELDFIAATAQQLPGVAGCRMTGGGFGGSAIALVRLDAAGKVTDALARAYAAAFGRNPGIFLTSPEDGAHVVSIN